MAKYFVMGEVTPTKRGWVRQYLTEVNAHIERHEGRVLSRSLNMEKLEGARALPTNVILIEFPSKDAVHAFFDDPAYEGLRNSRREGSISEMMIFPAEDFSKDL